MKKIISSVLAIATVFGGALSFNVTSSAKSFIQDNDFYLYNVYDTVDTEPVFENIIQDYRDTELVKRVLKGIDPSWTDVQKVAYVYSYIANQTRYGGGGSTYCSLYQGHGTCMSYTYAFKDIMDTLGFPCHYVSGVATVDKVLSGHAWNVVKVNGKWYNIDCNKLEFLQGNITPSGYYEDTCCDTHWSATGTNNFKVVSSSEYREKFSEGFYFESNGKWYYCSGTTVCSINNNLHISSIVAKYSLIYDCKTELVPDPVVLWENDIGWEPSCFTVANEKLYYDWKGTIREYNPQTNSTRIVYTIPYTVKSGKGGTQNHGDVTYSGKAQKFYEAGDCKNSPIAWIGSDKYAIYYILRDGTQGSVALGSDKNKLELTSTSKTIRVGEVTYATCMSSSMYRAGGFKEEYANPVTYKSSNTSIVDIDEDGYAYAKKTGTATITVSAFGRKNSYKITVKPYSYLGDTDGVEVRSASRGEYSNANTTTSSSSSGFDNRGGSLALDVNKKVKLSYLFTKSDSSVKFSSSNTKVAKIVKSSNGTRYVKAVGEGTAKISATLNGNTQSVDVTVVNIKKNTKISSVKLGKYGKDYDGSTTTVTLTSPKASGADEYEIVCYFTDNPNILNLTIHSNANPRSSNNEVTAVVKKSGKVKVYAINTSGDVKIVTLNVKK